MPKREIHREEEVTMHDIREISEDERQRMKDRTDKAKEQAMEALKEAETFAVFTLGTGTGKRGIETIVAGEMGRGETMELLTTMHDTIETVAEGVSIEVEASMHKGRRQHG